jgi:putative membrane protein
MMAILGGVALGVAIGLASGLLPGIHVNTLAAVLLASQAVLLPLFGPAPMAAALFAALIAHTFLDAIPSTFLGIPDADTAVSVLPAHSLCLEGKGEEAVRISALGNAAGLVIAVPCSLILLLAMPALQPYLDWGTGILLVAVMGFLIVRSESPGWAVLLFGASGVLGLFSFHYSFLSPSWAGEGGVLMPLLSGLFGISILLLSGQGPIPGQQFSGIGMERRGILRGSLLGTAAGTIVGWLPGLSNATANAVLATAVNYEKDRREYLLATSAANTVNAMVGLVAFFAIARTRSGVVAAMSVLELPPLPTLLLVGAVAGLASYLITVRLAGIAVIFSRLDRRALNTAVILFVAGTTILVGGIFGAFILLLATILGLVPRMVNIPQVYLIGAITLPVMLYSFGFTPF